MTRRRPAPSLVCASAALRARCASGVPYVSDSETLRSRSGTLTPDVVDPYGLPEEAYEETATEIEDFISRLVALEVATRREGSSEGKPVYMCQATELSDVTSFVSAHNPRTWINDVRSGNATARTALAGIAILALGKLRRATGATMPPARTNRSCDGTERGDSSHHKPSSKTQSPRPVTKVDNLYSPL